MVKVSLIGATGYAGGQLLNLLLNHGEAEIVHAVGVSSVGMSLIDAFPYLRGRIKGQVEALDLDKVVDESDVVFTAMHHGLAVEIAAACYQAGKKLIDIGCDFRFPDTAVYEKWYKVKHNRPDLASQAVYGLPELYRKEIADAQIIGNPGCYPTASILSLYPLAKAGLLVPDTVIVDAVSGVSGAGKNPTENNIYCSADGSVNAYGVAAHRHTPEIERILTAASGELQIINFTPHLAPMSRGILATSYAKIKKPLSAAELTVLYEQAYADEPFVIVHPSGVNPKTKWALGTNSCHISVTYDQRTGRAIATSAIDNLIKGAAGQALQNMNLLCGYDEQQGLRLSPLFP
ncbi:MAG: N-acetyl-gamma-glutamyl-phosphate reductase [Clostridia bacterium]|nr:N-acetyl-gamma-glutamyl-phosphate reductase [Clostridia bacterium]MDD4798948.1 N-acetyl-gamma-glutamyl-phosphate reductase [Clostridia bacterium]